LNQATRLSLFSSFLAAFLLLSLGACAVAFSPGYVIRKESREVQYLPGSPAALKIAAHYELKNSGTIDLDFVDVNLPARKVYGRENLRVEVDGRPAKAEELPLSSESERPETVRIPFESAWARGQYHELSIAYEFRSPADSGARITLGDANFHLSSRGWLPLPQPPKRILATYPSRPDRVIYTVIVPPDFRVLARGSLAGKKRHGDETEYRFMLRKNDLTPYLVAGRYAESSSDNDSTSAVFWTFQPLRENSAAAVQSITTVWNLLVKDFGPLDKSIRGPHVVESNGLSEHIPGEQGLAAAAFPGGALVSPEALAQGIDRAEFLDGVAHALAHNWFGDEVFFAPDAALGMGEGLPEYATLVIEESQKGEAARRQRVAAYLREYDQARSGGNEKPLGLTMLGDAGEQRRIGLAKAVLFYVALEDACGAEQMQTGLRRMVTLLRGQLTSYDALRSTLEESSGKNLAELFRVWLNDKNVPQDFRDRYQN
jgi:hypothetical protein